MLMEFLGAEQSRRDVLQRWITEEPPIEVLDRLEERGYRVVPTTLGSTVGMCFYVTLHKPSNQQ